MSVSKTFIGTAVCREFESEVPVAEIILDRVICSASEQFSFQMCLERGFMINDRHGTFRNWRQSEMEKYYLSII